ncbi:MAG: transcriptional regulator with XRE-family HTH domain [Saprospiraceae bacterium]|jgi:transcriptional regulator with XRE-family HTH domain
MDKLANNIKFLRKKQNLSQVALGESLMLSRSNLAKYEKGIHDPGIEVLLRISRYFKISVDLLLTVAIGDDNYEEIISQSSMIMPIQVDKNGDRVIEIIPHNASAGYLGSYSDPEYIENLEHLYLPFLPQAKNCRAFPINGDSMPPIIDGSYVIGEYVASFNDVKFGSRYIVVSRDEGIVFKRIIKVEQGAFHLQSDNPHYKTFTMPGREILEVWEFLAAISIQDSAAKHTENVLVEKINNLQAELLTLNEYIAYRD